MVQRAGTVFHGTVGQSSAQVIDGSLRFVTGSNRHLKRTPTTAGNGRVWTWSGWCKRQDLGSFRRLFEAGADTSNFTTITWQGDNDSIELMSRTSGSNKFRVKTARLFRDLSAWYHVVVSMNILNETQTEKCKIYINGNRITAFDDNTQQNEDETISFVNSTNGHFVGTANNISSSLEGLLSQVYLIDGIELDPSYFGFTDPLTNTWRPKKYTGNFNYVSPSDQVDYESGFDGQSMQAVDSTWLPFSGNTANNGFSQSKDTTCTYTAPGSGIAYTSTIRLFVKTGSGGANNLTIDGSSFTPDTGVGNNTGAWNDISSVVTGNLLNTIVTTRGSGGRNSYWSAIEVDGEIITHLQPGFNGFYLPLDGNSPIGQDRSGEENDFTPVNVGGSNSIEKATGAFPILNTINGGKVATAGVRTDSAVGAAATCLLALPLNDSITNLDVSHLVDSKATENTVTVTNVSPGLTGAAGDNFYGASYDFNGSNDELSFSVTNNGPFFLQSDFTMECWARIAGSQTDDRYFMQLAAGTATNSQGSWYLRINSSKFEGIIVNGNTQHKTISAENYTADKWTHVAYVREGNEQRLYVDGTLSATTSHTALPNINDSSSLSIGAAFGSNNHIDAQIQDVRVYTGVAKYTESFIPASTNPDIVPDTPSGVSLSSNLAKITNGSVNFDGTGDYLQIPNHADLRFGSDAFCVEAFVYYSETSGNGTIAGLWNSGSNRRSWLFQIESDQRRLRGFFSNDGSTVTQVNGSTGQMSRNAWHHVAFTRSGNDFRIFLDGVEVGSATSSNSLFDNSDDDIGVGSAQGGASSDPITGFISDVRIVKGSAVYTSDFTPPAAPLTNITNTKLLCSQSTVSATAADVIPTGSITANGNAVVTTFSPFNTDISAVRGQECNYATLNPRNRRSNAVLSNNNLSWTCDNSDSGTVLATEVVNSGKYYWEVTVDNGNRFHAGVHAGPGAQLATNDAGITAFDWAFRTDGAKVHGGAESTTNFFSVTGIGNVIQLAYDGDGGNLWFGANGHWFEGNPSALSGPSYTGVTSTGGISPMLNRRTNDNGASINFGQKPFKYAPPKGFQTLNSANIRSEIEVRPDQYVGIVTYRGTGATQSITGVGFQPDLVWTKQTDGTNTHALYDVVRTPPNVLYTSEQNSEESNAGYLTQIDPDGFTVGSADLSNVNNGSFVAWCWKAGGAAVSNTNGSVNSTVSANQDAGFSIVSYQASSGSSIGHGLGEQPAFMLIKNRDADGDWFVYHKNGSGGDLGSDEGLNFNNQDAKFTSGSNTFITAKNSSTFTVGSSSIVQNGSDDFIAYCWHDVPGLQKFGMYTGDGTTDGPYINCGFRPALLWVKNTSSGSTDWVMLDTTTSVINPMFRRFAANQQTAQVSDSSTNAQFDFYSNGFKSVGGDGTFVNTSGDNYIYCAWAETPTNNLYGAQANAK